MAQQDTFDWIARALSGELVVNLGQLDKPTIAALNKQVRAGKLARCRGCWSRLLIGPLKTIWAAPHARWGVGQLHEVVEATAAFWDAVNAERAAEAARVEAARLESAAKAEMTRWSGDTRPEGLSKVFWRNATFDFLVGELGARARDLWEIAGCPDGRDHQFWRNAIHDARHAVAQAA